MNKINPLSKLKSLKQEALIAKHPNFPPSAIPVPTYTDKTANGLTKMVIDWLQLNGHQAERINTMGVARVNKGPKDESFNRNFTSVIWTPSGSTKGSADISSVINGFSVKFEVKIGKDRQSEAQRKYEADVKKAGGFYFIVKDFNQFYELYLKLIDKLKPHDNTLF